MSNLIMTPEERAQALERYRDPKGRREMIKESSIFWQRIAREKSDNEQEV